MPVTLNSTNPRERRATDVDVFDSPWLTMFEEIAEASERLWVLQTWLPALHLNRWAWEAAMAKGALVRVLLLDQGLIDHRLRFRNRDESTLPRNVAELTQLASQFPGQLEGRFYSNLPIGPVYVVDNTVHWGLYFAHRDSMEGPRFTAPIDSSVGQSILESFDRTWDSSPWFSGEFQLPTADRIPPRDESLESAAREAKTQLASKLHLATSARHLESRHGAAFFVRHGETDMGVAGIVTGDLDVGINANGIRDARALGEKLRILSDDRPWDAIWASPLRRTTETLQHMLGGLDEVSQRSELGERLMGRAAGDFKQNHPLIVPGDFTSRDSSYGSARYGAESYAHVFNRLAPLLNEIQERVLEGERILICTHEGPIRMLLWAFDPDMAVGDAVSREIPYTEPFILVSDPRLKSQVVPRSILRVDIVDSTLVAERSRTDWAASQMAFRERAASIAEALRGRVFGEPGDEVLASFEDAQAAIKAGLQILNDVDIIHDGDPLAIRAGIDQGVVTVHSMNVEGMAVNRASRIVAIAPPGTLVVSESVYYTLRDSGRFTFTEPRQVELKGIAEQETIYTVHPT